MPALKSLPSLAQVQANRQNAARSTGPRTEAGKLASRRNATKHGLTGAGVALPTEDGAAVAERFAALRDQLRPATPLGDYYVGRMALAMVRTERAARHETAALSLRVRHAVEEFEVARAAAADAALARLRIGEGRAARRALLQSPEGIDRLGEELASLRRCLELPEPLWSREHGARLDAALGVAPDPIIPSRVEALSVALQGIAHDLLTRRDLAAIAEAGITEPAYALRQLAALIDEESAALRTDRAAINPALIEADRAEAADRALFDPSPAAQLARRYEAAAAREVDRALRYLRAVEPEPVAEAEMASVPSEEGLSRPIPSDAPTAKQPIEEPATVVVNSQEGINLTSVLAPFGSEPSAAEDAAPAAVEPEADEWADDSLMGWVADDIDIPE